MFEQISNKSELNYEFQRAVEAQDNERVKELFAPLIEFKSRADSMTDEEYEQGMPAVMEKVPYLDFEMVTTQGIMRAAQLENWSLLEFLYDMEASLDVKVSPQEWYLIHECIVSAPDNVTKAIIEYSNVNVQTAKGETPLMIAIKNEKKIMANYLLESGRVNLQLTDKKGNNAAHYAAIMEDYSFLLKLIERGTHFMIKNKEGKTAVDLIEDESFRMEFPDHLAKIEAAGHKISLARAQEVEAIAQPVLEKIESEVPTEEKPKKKVTGLSSIKKKTL